MHVSSARPRYNTLRLGAAFLLATSLALLGACGGKSAYPPSMAKDRAACTLEMSLPNMACGEACPVKVRAALGRVDGVRTVDVNYEERSAIVTAVYPACSADGYDQMVDGLVQLGYTCRIIAAY